MPRNILDRNPVFRFSKQPGRIRNLIQNLLEHLDVEAMSTHGAFGSLCLSFLNH